MFIFISRVQTSTHERTQKTYVNIYNSICIMTVEYAYNVTSSIMFEKFFILAKVFLHVERMEEKAMGLRKWNEKYENVEYDSMFIWVE